MGIKRQVVINKKDSESPLSPEADVLISDLRHSLCRNYSGAVTVNISLTFLYWQVGIRISKEILKDHRAEYGKQILATVSQQLSWSHFRGQLSEELWEQKRHCALNMPGYAGGFEL